MLSEKPHADNGGIRLESLVDATHPLVKLTQRIDWEQFVQQFGKLYSEEGRPGVPIRVMVGLHYLKSLYNESDESVVAKWVENPYWQYFCGCETFQHALPCHPTSLVKWRKRVGAEGMEQLLKGVLTMALSVHALQPEQIRHVIADTTVQEKAIAFPTDARLYHKARRQVIRLAKQAGLKLRQTYERASKQALYWQGRYTAAQQFKRAARQTRKLQVFLGRVLRDVQRKAPQPSQDLQQGLTLAQRIHAQQRHDSPKLYSVHAPEVECITKGKLHKKYEFGCKVAFTSTAQDNWIVGVQAHHDNPYDGATLAPALAQVEALTGVKPTEAVVDQGYRGLVHHPDGVTVHVVGRHKALGALQHLFRRRSAIEPIISHSKHEHGMARNHLLGQAGDKINALLSACGFNLAKLLHFFRQPLPAATPVSG
jgi:IS5 family transposase